MVIAAGGCCRTYKGSDVFYQRTLKNSVTVEGVGLHSGKPSSVVISPAGPGTGIVFVSCGVVIPASYENVTDTGLATTLGKSGVSVRTVEHLLAALSGLGVDNAVVEVDGPEVPVMDGSADAFVEALHSAGITVQEAHRRYIKVVKPLTVHDGDKSASILPSPVPRVTFRIDFDHPMIADQRLSLELDADTFVEEVASTRTFGFLKDVERLQNAGLALGGSLANAVVVDDGKVLNEEGLRYPDEFVRHKILDAIGDVSLSGMPIIGHLVMDKSGHALNHRLVRELVANPECWVILEGADVPGIESSLSLTEAV